MRFVQGNAVPSALMRWIPSLALGCASLARDDSGRLADGR